MFLLTQHKMNSLMIQASDFFLLGLLIVMNFRNLIYHLFVRSYATAAICDNNLKRLEKLFNDYNLER